METYSTPDLANMIKYSPLGTTKWYNDNDEEIDMRGHNGQYGYTDIAGNDISDIIIHHEDMIFPDANWDNTIINTDDLEQILQPDEYGIVPILVAKKSTYTQAHRKAQQKYREKFPEKYCEIQRKLYEDKKQDEEWKKKFNERSRINNKKYREKKNKEILEAGGSIKPRGRPRKIKEEKPEPIEVPIQNLEHENPPNNGNNFCVRCENFVDEPLDAGYCKKCSEAIWKECEEENAKIVDQLVKKKIIKKKIKELII